MNIKLNMSTFMLILDTLYGSLSLADGGRLFKYTRDQRELVFRELEKSLQEVKLTVEVTQNEN